MTVTIEQRRAAVVAEAMSWLRTPYHHRARVKGAGVDCAQFPIAVYGAAGEIPDVRPDYPIQWHLHRDAERYLEHVERFARLISEKARGADEPIVGTRPTVGDFAVWRFGRTFSHGAIVLNDEGDVIHAHVGRAVEIGNMFRDEELRVRPVRFYSVWL